MKFDRLLHKPLLYLTLSLVLLGIFFRTAHLDTKIFWVDEVSTALRVSGYTRSEVTTELMRHNSFPIAELQQYQKITPSRPISATLAALQKSPEHVPLYFLLTRLWLDLWGSSVVAIRSLSVIFSLLAIPCLYYLCLELFTSDRVGKVAVLLMAVSPFYIAYAQEARPYSLWILLILLSSMALLRSLRSNNLFDWSLYLVSLVLTLYTSLLSILVAIAQGIYLIIREKLNYPSRLRAFSFVVGIAAIAFLPWLIVIINNWQRLDNNTTWMRESFSFLKILVIWLYSIAIIFVESPLYLRLDFFMATRLAIDVSIFIITGIAFYRLWQQKDELAFVFILCLTLAVPIVLLSIDIIFNGQASATSRYLIPAQLGILVAISHLFATKIFTLDRTNRVWQIIFTCLLTIEISSCLYTFDRSPFYQKDENKNNLIISKIINLTNKPTIITSSDNILDLISLSYSLKSSTKVNFIDDDLQALTTFDRLTKNDSNLFILNPSLIFQQKVDRLHNWQIQEIDRPNLLTPDEAYLSVWQIRYFRQ
jgi:uncharacterized membrane protein